MVVLEYAEGFWPSLNLIWDSPARNSTHVLRCNNKQKTVLSAWKHFIVVFVLCIKANLEAHFFVVYLSRAEHLVSLFSPAYCSEWNAPLRFLQQKLSGGVFFLSFYVSGSAEEGETASIFAFLCPSHLLRKGSFFCISAAAKLSEESVETVRWAAGGIPVKILYSLWSWSSKYKWKCIFMYICQLYFTCYFLGFLFCFAETSGQFVTASLGNVVTGKNIIYI